MSPTAQVDVVVLQHLLNFWDSQGIEIDPVWQILGIDTTQPLPRWVSTDRLAEVYVFLSQQGYDLGFFVSAGKYLAEQELPLGHLLKHGESLEQALPLCFRFAYLMVGSVEFELKSMPQSRKVLVRPVNAEHASHQQLLVALSTLTHACYNVIQGSHQQGDLQVFLPDLDDRYPDAVMAFDVPVVQADCFALEISMAAWQRNNPHRKESLFRIAQREFEREHQKFTEYLAVYTELKDILQQCLLQRNVSQEDVAGRLGISVRNLQRRLKALGTTYQLLLDEARQALAMRLLQDEATPLYEVSFMVGYNEPSAFYKAFKRWTGMTPGDYRLTHMPAQQAARINAVSDEV